MTVGIIHAFARLLLGAFAPGSGRRRADSSPTAPASTATRREAPPRTPLPLPRSPYGRNDPLDGHASALVRPYLAAYEQQETRTRRLTLVLAADLGIDLDARSLHGVEVAR
ncbi:hypothetical protein [Streptomyces sp. TRM49041]|uniref:hypothetical protein n=1 Tax=Streptomyces sp. TRM49041 TaxID=2603216 RepID=UPI0011ECDCE3|nr:hypothetical protein [Streptomyces sp. TRM49041]